MTSSSEPLIEAVYSRPQINEFLEKTDPKTLLDLNKIYLTTHPFDPNMGRKIRIIGERLPSTWNEEFEPSRSGKDPENFIKAMKDECTMVQDYYLLHKAQFHDVNTVAGQQRLATETGAKGSSIILHYYNPERRLIAQNLAKGWLALAKALNSGNFGSDAIICISLARFGMNDETSRLKIRANCQPTAEMVREIERILRSVHLKCSLKIKNDVASYLSWLTNDRKMPRIVFEAPLKGRSRDMDQLARQLEAMKT